MSLLKRIEEEVKSWNLNEFIENTILGLIAFFLATGIHELGHVIVGNILGCPSQLLHVGLILGVTGVSDTCPPSKMMIIALAGPIFAFLTGIYIWFKEDKDSKLRLLSIILFLISSIVQLVPTEPLDGYKAIYFGFPVIAELFIFFVVFSISINLILHEIEDRKWEK